MPTKCYKLLQKRGRNKINREEEYSTNERNKRRKAIGEPKRVLEGSMKLFTTSTSKQSKE